MNKNQGFTLIELVVVIAVIAILAATIISIINPFEAQRASRDSIRLSQLNGISSALELYFASYKDYPATPTSGNLDLSQFNSRISWTESVGCGIRYTKITNGYTLIAPLESASFKIPEGSTVISIVSKPSDYNCPSVTNVILVKVTQ
jgi:prepilin-type N-terminal cleavage/methylation domain-containing protein